MNPLYPFLVALQFLTRIPVQLKHTPDEETLGRSMLYYPIVGLVIAAVLIALHLSLTQSPIFIHVALLLLLWILITGGLHLDGLADSTDAWIGGQGDREQTLTIMTDPRCGPAGVVSIVMILLLKFAALHALLVNEQVNVFAALLLAPVLARTMVLGLFLTTTYVRHEGLGSALTQYLPRKQARLMLLATLLVLPVVLGSDAIWAISASLVVALFLRNAMNQRLQGCTGDTAGALVELVEVGILLVLAVK